MVNVIDMKRIAINGFGRIGRLTLRNLLQCNGVKVVAINDRNPSRTMAHLFTYDTAHGRYPLSVSSTPSSLHIDHIDIAYSQIIDPQELPWHEHHVDIVLECTGVFKSKLLASKHLLAGAQRVIVSAPTFGQGIPFIVMGINDHILRSNMRLISNASCTTNCLGPVVKLIHDEFNISQGFVTTTHSYTADQRLQDAPHKDLRRARAAAQNIIPTTTGAAVALEVVLPEIKGRLHADAIRVPILTGSLIELTCTVEKNTSIDQINALFKSAASGKYKGILAYNEDEIVSSDIVGNPHSSIFDAPLTRVNHNLIKVTSWYDNESGYAARMCDLTLKVADLMV